LLKKVIGTIRETPLSPKILRDKVALCGELSEAVLRSPIGPQRHFHWALCRFEKAAHAFHAGHGFGKSSRDDFPKNLGKRWIWRFIIRGREILEIIN